jgi:hypothetical protein
MAEYQKDGKHMTPSAAVEFGVIHKPGELAPFSGIYRCECSVEATVEGGRHLPTTHLMSGASAAAVLLCKGPRWQLLVKATHRLA